MQNRYNYMKTYLIISVIVYVALTSVGATAALTATLKVYALWGREPPETLTAAIVNTAAVFAATGFIGVLDMFMTLWTLLRSADWEKEAREEREKERQARQAESQVRAQERAVESQAQQKRWEAERETRETERQAQQRRWEAEREDQERRWEAQRWERQEERAFQQQVIGQLTAQQERSDLMMTRILELVEQISNRANGNGSHPAASNPEP